MKKIKYLIFVLLIAIMPMFVMADTGAKPSITVKIKNLETTNYLIDLFVMGDENSSTCEMNYNGNDLSEEEIKQLYELNYDGWISASMRWNCNFLFADVAGNSNYENTFSYFGTPTRYKVLIINKDTGEIKLSDEITREDFNSTITIDYETMNLIDNKDISKTIINAIIALVLTVVVEVIVAIIFKLKNYKYIALINALTNILLQVLLVVLYKYYLVAFIVGEILVLGAELIAYLLKIKDVSKMKIVLYTVIANCLTILITLILK